MELVVLGAGLVDGEHHLVGGELVTVVGAQPVPTVGQGAGEPGVAGEHLDVGRGTPVVITAGGEGVDPAEHA